jgi:hypothetical protein
MSSSCSWRSRFVSSVHVPLSTIRNTLTVNNSGLQKYFDDVDGLHSHEFFSQLSKDVEAGEVFPAIRKNEVHFYYGGARLCIYKDGQMHTNNRYLDTPDNGKSRDVCIPEDRFTPVGYERLKEKCRGYRSPDSELSIVSELFPKFSIARLPLPLDRAYLLDIECRFPGGEAPDDLAQDMIDCLFLTPEGALVFVEIKRTDNPKARGGGKSKPEVEGQIERYRRKLGSKALREEIKTVYTSVINILGKILRQRLPLPQTVFPNVPLLIVGAAFAPSSRSKEVWQRDLLAAPRSLNSEIIGIDGRSEQVNASLDAFFRTLAVKSAEGAGQ